MVAATPLANVLSGIFRGIPPVYTTICIFLMQKVFLSVNLINEDSVILISLKSNLGCICHGIPLFVKRFFPGFDGIITHPGARSSRRTNSK